MSQTRSDWVLSAIAPHILFSSSLPIACAAHCTGEVFLTSSIQIISFGCGRSLQVRRRNSYWNPPKARSLTTARFNEFNEGIRTTPPEYIQKRCPQQLSTHVKEKLLWVNSWEAQGHDIMLRAALIWSSHPLVDGDPTLQDQTDIPAYNCLLFSDSLSSLFYHLRLLVGLWRGQSVHNPVFSALVLLGKLPFIEDSNLMSSE